MGDGRHRSDPRGGSRYLIAILGITVALALVAVGGYALYSVLTHQSQPPAASSATGLPTGAEETSSDPVVVKQPAPGRASRDRRTRTPTLSLTVTGRRCYVSVRVPGGKVLLNKTLRHGAVRRFFRPELRVTVGDPEAVRVKVNGKRRDPDKRGLDTFTASRSE